MDHWRRDWQAREKKMAGLTWDGRLRAERREWAEQRMELEETIRQLEKMLRDAGLLPGLPVPPPEPRYLVCHEILAKGVPQDSDGPVDRSKGKGGTDPYVRLLLLDGGPSATKKESAFTSYLQNMENPVWDGERLQMRLTPGGDRPPKLRVEMWDKDMFTPDEMIA